MSAVITFLLAIFSLAKADPGMNSFTPDQVVVPVIEVGVINENTGTNGARVPLYTCSGSSNQNCLVDLANQAAVQSILNQTVTVPAGKYLKTYVRHCTDLSQNHYEASILGQVSIAGKTYYTSKTENPITLNAAAKSLIPISMNGCISEFKLPTPMTVAAGETVQLSLISDVFSLAWAGTSPAPSIDSCLIANQKTLCLNYPELIPAVAKTSVSKEQFAFLTKGQGSVLGLMILLTDESGTPLSGVFRQIYMEDMLNVFSGFTTPIESIQIAADGTLNLKAFPPNGDAIPMVQIPQFKRMDHVGQLLVKGKSVAYQTFRWPKQKFKACTADLNQPVFSDFMTWDANTQTHSKLDSVTPIGGVNNYGGHVFPADHVYLNLKKVNPANPDSVRMTDSIKMPVTSTIYEIMRQEIYVFKQQKMHVDYSVRFSPCDEVRGFFHHFNTLSPTLNDKITNAGLPSPQGFTTLASCEASLASLNVICSCNESPGDRVIRACNLSGISVPISAGDSLGDVGGEDNFSFDMGLYDLRVPVTGFVSPKRFDANGSENYTNTRCPFDLFTTNTADSYRSIFLGKDGVAPTTEPKCGTVAQDVAGTLKGLWFKPGQPTYPENPHMSLIRNEGNSLNQIISCGTSNPTLQKSYDFKVEHTGRINRDFAEIQDNKIYCYQNLRGIYESSIEPNKIVLISKDPNGKLKIEGVDKPSCADLGAESSWSHSANAVLYER